MSWGPLIIYQPFTIVIFISCETLLTCISNNLPLVYEFLPLCELPNLSMGHKQVLASFYLPMDFFHHQNILHGLFIRYPYENHMSTPHAHLQKLGLHFHSHGNLALHCDLASLTMLICWVFFFFSLKIVCVDLLGLPCVSSK